MDPNAAYALQVMADTLTMLPGALLEALPYAIGVYLGASGLKMLGDMNEASRTVEYRKEL